MLYYLCIYFYYLSPVKAVKHVGSLVISYPIQALARVKPVWFSAGYLFSCIWKWALHSSEGFILAAYPIHIYGLLTVTKTKMGKCPKGRKESHCPLFLPLSFQLLLPICTCPVHSCNRRMGEWTESTTGPALKLLKITQLKGTLCCSRASHCPYAQHGSSCHPLSMSLPHQGLLASSSLLLPPLRTTLIIGWSRDS